MQNFDDPDLLAMGVRRRGFPMGWVFFFLAVIACGIFVGAYYLPLYNGHQKLASEHEALAKSARSVADELTRTQEEVKRVEGERSALQARVAASDDKQKGELQHATDLGQKVEGALSKRVKQHWATVVTADNTVTVRIPTAILFAPNSLTLSKHGGPFLCEVVSALGSGALIVAAHTAAAEVNATLAKTYPTAWDLTAAESAAVAANLVDQCNAPAAHVSAQAHANSQPLDGAKASENNRIELSVSVASGKE